MQPFVITNIIKRITTIIPSTNEDKTKALGLCWASFFFLRANPQAIDLAWTQQLREPLSRLLFLLVRGSQGLLSVRFWSSNYGSSFLGTESFLRLGWTLDEKARETADHRDRPAPRCDWSVQRSSAALADCGGQGSPRLSRRVSNLELLIGHLSEGLVLQQERDTAVIHFQLLSQVHLCFTDKNGDS